MFLNWNLRPSVYNSPLFLVGLVNVSTINDVTKDGGKGTIELDLGNILFPGCLVHFLVNEGFHRVNVNECLHKFVVWIGEDLGSQRLLKVEVIDHVEDLLP